MITNINSIDGHSYTFDSDTELISKDGVIVPYSEYQPVYVMIDNDEEPPIFSGILSKLESVIITPTGRINKIINSTNEIKI